MAMKKESRILPLLQISVLILLVTYSTYRVSAAPNIGTDFYVTWSDRLVQSPDGGKTISVSLDYNSGSAIGTTAKYVYGYFSAQIKLVGDNSAGTLATFYLKSLGENAVHDELDFEFLGNSSGQPYSLQTNVFANDLGGREQRMNLWFDPRADFHTYAILWNSNLIIFYVDGTPIRIFPNNNGLGVNYLQGNPMKLYSTIYNADSWVTQGGKVKIDWSYAPFTVTFKNYMLQGCASEVSGATACSSSWWDEPQYWSFTTTQMQALKNIQATYVTYNYCTDRARFSTPPAECSNT
ncbi:hypothetical protein R1sor_017358 [Riccia sorocarpa]|uniref:Xyloglucan endotransglucosylase/hydrolase n=1 Tax=Riccia sorocarpa TaxID=122646 RepID=A0ABD3I704_9MARC